MVTLARRVNRIPLAPVVGVMFGLVAAILVAAMPGWMFDSIVVRTGLPSILPFAAPPLGMTARILAMVFAALVVGAGLWLVIALIEKTLASSRKQPALWHDAGYTTADEPVRVEGRRRPIFAPAELGAPLMSDEAIASMQPLNGQPLDGEYAAMTSQSVADVPDKAWIHPAPEPEPASSWLTAPSPLPELAPEPELEVPLSAAEFDLPPSETPDDDDNSIQSLIRRLESGLARRAANDPGPDAPTSAPTPLTLSKDWIIADNALRVTPSDPDDTQSENNDIQQALGTLQRFASR